MNTIETLDLNLNNLAEEELTFCSSRIVLVVVVVGSLLWQRQQILQRAQR